MTEAVALWSYLAQEPLLWLTLTLAAYVIADRLAEALGRHPVANPVLISVILLAVILKVTATPYAIYFEGAQFVHFMLGPATVGLALPLYFNLARVRQSLLPMLAALLAGSLVAILSALGIAWALGVRGQALLSLAPKSATAPVALGVSEAIGGQPTLTAVLVILTGITGAIVATPMLNLLGVTDWRARGFAVGVAAHGIGTAHAFRVHETAGAFSGIGMGLNAVLTAVLAPLVVGLLF
ncbi:LrgB family protein [Tropicibacter naphthalenivorans]|uniref:Inner membrane protein YohK n=1 Tax=Tropicibacter naphthalenivorans TaxID=441103 RepID=A0A0P1GDP1_9RHOB|nr:LrgB family protein [Tropicibacter naphthalenivorans]CUH79442.1 Inner membrane protein YohK [Tropicibacter naphthalenivorans]SMC72261.1 TIGR00659 family protein [Tropicibacter naphthalenivorans]